MGSKVRLQALLCEKHKIMLEVEASIRAVSRLPWIDEQIEAAQEALWWERFIVYCNTPCWRFRVAR